MKGNAPIMSGLSTRRILLTLLVVTLYHGSALAGFWGSSSPEEPNQVQPAPPFKFDYKLSVKKPYLYNGTIPFWSLGGGTRATRSVP